MTRAVVLNKDDFTCMGHLVMSGDIFDNATSWGEDVTGQGFHQVSYSAQDSTS